MDGDRDASDEVLWRRVVNGDGDAFGALYDRHRDRVLGHALKIVRSAHTAEDVTAIVFYEAWRRRADVRIVHESILAWLLVTANHTIRNHTRQQRRYQHLLSQLPPPASSTDIAEEVAEADQRSSQAAALRAAFTQLKPLDRDVLTLCVVEEFSGLSWVNAARSAAAWLLRWSASATSSAMSVMLAGGGSWLRKCWYRRCWRV